MRNRREEDKEWGGGGYFTRLSKYKVDSHGGRDNERGPQEFLKAVRRRDRESPATFFFIPERVHNADAEIAQHRRCGDSTLPRGQRAIHVW